MQSPKRYVLKKLKTMDIVQNNSRVYRYTPSSVTFKLMHALSCTEHGCVSIFSVLHVEVGP
jgi:hypothetical protein